MKVKQAFNLLVTLSLLVVGPKDNRNFLFRTPESYAYGEVLVYSDGEAHWSIAKNASNELVRIPANQPAAVYGTDLNDGAPHHTMNLIRAQTLALIRRDPAEQVSLLVELGNENPKEPRSLQIATEDDRLDMLIWPALLMSLSVCLALLINDFSWQCNSPLRDLIELDE